MRKADVRLIVTRMGEGQNSGKLTPLMQQYWEIKSQHQDQIVLFRMGDFYEMFHQDAEIAAPILNIALTQRNKKSNDSTKMCGVPHHSIAGPIGKLLKAGHKVAICDQIEDPAVAKGIVKRAVTRVLTPGMVYDPYTLDELAANYLCAYDESHVAFVDVTTGEAFYYAIEMGGEREELIHLLSPVELVLSSKQMKADSDASGSRSLVRSVFDGVMNGDTPTCVQRLRQYISHMQGESVLATLNPFKLRERRTHLRLSPTTIRHLEIFENARGEREGALFYAINRTQTSAGARLLKSWLLTPLLDLTEIMLRQNEINLWLKAGPPLKVFRQTLAQLGDVERRLGKIHASNFNARDLYAIAESVLNGQKLAEMHPAQPLQDANTRSHLEVVVKVAEQITRTLAEELPLSVKEGGMIRAGVYPELDELIQLTQNSQQLLLELEQREREQTGINSLKVRYNNVFGFYIELTKTHADKAPAHYQRKQTLTNAERFTTDELNRLEEKILSARSRRDQLENEIFLQLRQKVIDLSAELLDLNRLWTRWDVLSALAWLAIERKYCCPTFNNQGLLDLQHMRHPVVEQTLGRQFVPNSLTLQGGECLLLTGPNMAGKSTLMRQVGLIGILAQIGSLVPAGSANLPLFDQIFSRIGASDSLNEGLSTFMVEMTETAQILKRATTRSLVIMDEIGRGTSTYDGLSLAQAILEYLITQKHPYLLFATHYHELTAITPLYPQILNGHMSVQEKGGQIQFLHTLKKGPANRSYGIQVATLAGLPTTVTQRAQTLLKEFENQGVEQLSLPLDAQTPSPQVTLPPWVDEIKNLDLSQMTPLEALNKLFGWQREASS